MIHGVVAQAQRGGGSSPVEGMVNLMGSAFISGTSTSILYSHPTLTESVGDVMCTVMMHRSPITTVAAGYALVASVSVVNAGVTQYLSAYFKLIESSDLGTQALFSQATSERFEYAVGRYRKTRDGVITPRLANTTLNSATDSAVMPMAPITTDVPGQMIIAATTRIHAGSEIIAPPATFTGIPLTSLDMNRLRMAQKQAVAVGLESGNFTANGAATGIAALSFVLDLV